MIGSVMRDDESIPPASVDIATHDSSERIFLNRWDLIPVFLWHALWIDSCVLCCGT